MAWTNTLIFQEFFPSFSCFGFTTHTLLFLHSSYIILFQFKRLEWFVERANRREWERIRVLREARKPTTVQESNLVNLPAKTSDCPSVLIIRTCRKQNMTKVTKKLLNQFRLQRVYQACLARLDQQMMNKLSILKECVVWGHVAPMTVRDLIMKRGRMGTMSNATTRFEPWKNKLVLANKF